MSLEEIRKMEEMGLDVIVTGDRGKLLYATETGDGHRYCDVCECLRFVSDPDHPNDWFSDGAQKALCTEKKAMIAGALEPREMNHITKPLWCPKLGRELTDEEKREAAERLEDGRKKYE